MSQTESPAVINISRLKKKKKNERNKHKTEPKVKNFLTNLSTIRSWLSPPCRTKFVCHTQLINPAAVQTLSVLPVHTGLYTGVEVDHLTHAAAKYNQLLVEPNLTPHRAFLPYERKQVSTAAVHDVRQHNVHVALPWSTLKGAILLDKLCPRQEPDDRHNYRAMAGKPHSDAAALVEAKRRKSYLQKKCCLVVFWVRKTHNEKNCQCQSEKLSPTLVEQH